MPFEAVSLDQLGAEADVVITITSSFDAILMADQVRPGMHLACMGTDTKGKQEVDAQYWRARLFLRMRWRSRSRLAKRSMQWEQGLIAAGISSRSVTRSTAITRGAPPTTKSLCFDGTGVGLQDLAVASAAVRRGIEKGLAIEVEI